MRDVWNELGQRDPLWAVLTRPDKRGGRWDEGEFFATGRDEIAAAMGQLRELAPDLRRRRALDFGCGVGRLSRALAAHFERVDGVDAAASMIAHARRFDRGGAVTFHENARGDLRLFDDATFDLVYSTITLQHIAPARARRYVAEFARVLAPGGIAVFQLPERPLRARSLPQRVLANWTAPLRRRLRHLLSAEPPIDMFGHAPDAVRALLARGGCDVLAVDPDTSAGPNWVSWTYVARRPELSGPSA